ncbi:P-type ATPase [Bordetella genomosp. 11]|uniref:P-type ATPase n=1 Tax=Bordetella genomosp. 11 TaxID=1416808 RepID=UPI001140854B|nr:cation-translocating P-type ATPase [Bordetella genomosp. 11]
MRPYSIFSIPAGLSPADRQVRRHALLRLGLAWLVMMQVMMLAWPAYVRHDDLPARNLATLDWAIGLMNWASLALTLPVLVYSAWPLWHGAATRLWQGRPGMDLPVATGMAAAFVPSVHATIAGDGAVYFDSVTMFVAFLLTARYLALCARQSRAGGRNDPLRRTRATLTLYADRRAAQFCTVQLAATFATGLVWIWLDPGRFLPVTVAMLVISCPCALSMSVPAVMASADAAIGALPCADEADIRAIQAMAARKAMQNLYGSAAFHLLMMPLAALGWVTPWLAAVTMLVSSLAVAGNAWRLHGRWIDGHASARSRASGAPAEGGAGAAVGTP